MRRVVILALVAVLGCKRGEAAKPTAQSTTGSAIGGGPVQALLPGATCAFPDKIDEDVTIKAGCVADVRSNVLVANGRTLTIEPGVKLRFHPKTYLEIGHKGSRIVARGTRDNPIVFTSAASSPQRGDWIGLVFDDAPGEGSTLEHAVIEYAGRESHGGQGAITVFRAFPEKRVSIRDVKLRHNETALTNRHPSATFAAFERNSFSDNARALRVSLPVLAAFGEGNDIADPAEILGGTLVGRGTLQKTKGGYNVMEPIYVNGEGGNTASLTIGRGVALRFAPKTWLEVGTGGPAELHVDGATFTSLSSTPRAGDWVGLFFGDKSQRSTVTDSTIEYAGAEEHGSDAAVTFVGSKSWQALDVHFAGVSFRHLQQAHFSSNGDGCNKALDPKHAIGWAGLIDPCR